ncbi:MAG: aldehyde ferredoxin oxidoreductase family protein, partial [Sciscionella sp.]
MAPGGFFGRALIVEVSGRAATGAPLRLDERVLRSYLGGVGLGTWLLHRLAPPMVDPLAPEAPLAFVFSSLVGTPLTTSAKFAVVAKSPLTGLLTDALASSQFAISGKLTGHDAIVIRGHAAELSVLLIDGDGVRIEPAPELAGSSAAAAETAARERFGRGWRTAAIGPAGERGVRYATISHDGRHAGRGGLGAVLGAKNIKAVLVRAATKVAVADQAGVLAAARDLRKRSFGPATAKYRELGTLANLLAFNAVSTLPTRNFTAATFDAAPKLAAEELHEMRGVARNSCASCSIGCEHIYSRKGGGSQRMEYENVFALGPLCGVSDPDDVFAASARCDELGIDTISAGGTIAWAMECVERGLIDAPWLRFGDGAALLRALDAVGTRAPGIGELLAQGSRRAAETVGHDSIDFAAQVKGLELPGYEPRSLQSMALGLAVNARGADHNRSGAYEADLSGELDRLDGGAAHVAAAIGTEDRAAVMDSMILCKFLRGVFAEPFTEWATLLRLVTGWEVDADELRTTARRIVRAKRAFNLREGATSADDWLPARILRTPLELGSGRTASLSADRLRAM